MKTIVRESIMFQRMRRLLRKDSVTLRGSMKREIANMGEKSENGVAHPQHRDVRVGSYH